MSPDITDELEWLYAHGATASIYIEYKVALERKCVEFAIKNARLEAVIAMHEKIGDLALTSAHLAEIKTIAKWFALTENYKTLVDKKQAEVERLTTENADYRAENQRLIEGLAENVQSADRARAVLKENERLTKLVDEYKLAYGNLVIRSNGWFGRYVNVLEAWRERATHGAVVAREQPVPPAAPLPDFKEIRFVCHGCDEICGIPCSIVMQDGIHADPSRCVVNDDIVDWTEKPGTAAPSMQFPDMQFPDTQPRPLGYGKLTNPDQTPEYEVVDEPPAAPRPAVLDDARYDEKTRRVFYPGYVCPICFREQCDCSGDPEEDDKKPVTAAPEEIEKP